MDASVNPAAINEIIHLTSKVSLADKSETKPTTLTMLPNEMLLEIAKYLPPCDLARLKQVSRDLCIFTFTHGHVLASKRTPWEHRRLLNRRRLISLTGLDLPSALCKHITFLQTSGVSITAARALGSFAMRYRRANPTTTMTYNDLRMLESILHPKTYWIFNGNRAVLVPLNDMPPAAITVYMPSISLASIAAVMQANRETLFWPKEHEFAAFEGDERWIEVPPLQLWKFGLPYIAVANHVTYAVRRIGFEKFKKSYAARAERGLGADALILARLLEMIEVVPLL